VAARDPAPLRVLREHRRERSGIAGAERGGCSPKLIEDGVVHPTETIRPYARFGHEYADPMTNVITEATITCPACSARTTAEMPTNACQFFYTCPACSARLRPLPGDCCVFCSYADQVCPPKQSGDLHDCC
jgi:hypothetical protein